MKTAVRRVLLMSALMSPGALYALGLGEIRLNSALNQPFDAEIELVSAAQEDLAALRASLASGDTFQRYGLDKPAYLSDFTFRVVSSGGRDVLKVTSPRPVTEPFVTLLVEANWPRGRLLREYTVLLDPPVFAPAPAATVAPVAPPRATTTPPAPRPVPVEAPAPQAAPAPTAPRASRPTAAIAAEPGSTYRVRPNDTLWEIASDAYPGARSDVNRAMVAIYQANPAAFGGNINVLRAGSNLRMPSSGDVAAISASAAAEEVARQYRLWQQGTPAAAGPATDVGRLRLVTPEQGSAAPSTATAAPAAAASTEAMQGRVQQLEQELAEARRLLEVRNAELATLQGTTAPTQPATPAEGAAPVEPAAPSAGSEGAPAAVEAPAATAAPEPQAAPEPAKPKAAPREVEPEPSLLDRLRAFWWAPLGLLLALLGLLAFLRNRRASGSVEDDLEAALSRKAEDLRNRPSTPPSARESSIVVEERRAAEPVAARVAPAAAAKSPEPSRKPVSIEDTLSGEGPVSIEAGDPLAEADFHMAYGLYDQAADLVQVAARREPQRRDLKLKLLEIFFVWGNRDRFLEVARDMHATRGEAQPGEWDKILIMGRQLAADDPLFAGAATPAASAGLDMELHDTDAAMDFELPALGADARPDLDLSVRDATASPAGAGLDFMLDEPVRGADEDAALAPTVETPRLRSAAADEPTTEVPIEDLGIDVGDLAGLDEMAETEVDLTLRPRAVVDDTVERPNLSRVDADDDLLSSTSIMSGETITQIAGEPEPGVVDLSEMTGELPALDAGKTELTGMHRAPDFGIDGEAATMSEVGTKLDLARAYIDMGDPEGARSILDEVLREGSPVQRKEAERLLAGLP
jgi:pilus assembly protein FimV